MIKKILLFTAGVASGVVLMLVVPTSVKMPSMTQVHYTTEPLLLYSNVANASRTLLPVGTPLYYDSTTSPLDKLGDRYIVYVTMNEDFPLTSRADFGDPDSIEARNVNIEQLPQLLRDYPISEEDVKRIREKECRPDMNTVTTISTDVPVKAK